MSTTRRTITYSDPVRVPRTNDMGHGMRTEEIGMATMQGEVEVTVDLVALRKLVDEHLGPKALRSKGGKCKVVGDFVTVKRVTKPKEISRELYAENGWTA